MPAVGGGKFNDREGTITAETILDGSYEEDPQSLDVMDMADVLFAKMVSLTDDSITEEEELSYISNALRCRPLYALSVNEFAEAKDKDIPEEQYNPWYVRDNPLTVGPAIATVIRHSEKKITPKDTHPVFRANMQYIPKMEPQWLPTKVVTKAEREDLRVEIDTENTETFLEDYLNTWSADVVNCYKVTPKYSTNHQAYLLNRTPAPHYAEELNKAYGSLMGKYTLSTRVSKRPPIAEALTSGGYEKLFEGMLTGPILVNIVIAQLEDMSDIYSFPEGSPLNPYIIYGEEDLEEVQIDSENNRTVNRTQYEAQKWGSIVPLLQCLCPTVYSAYDSWSYFNFPLQSEAIPRTKLLSSILKHFSTQSTNLIVKYDYVPEESEFGRRGRIMIDFSKLKVRRRQLCERYFHRVLSALISPKQGRISLHPCGEVSNINISDQFCSDDLTGEFKPSIYIRKALTLWELL